MPTAATLSETLAHALGAPSPFYHARLTQAGLADARALRADALGRLPLTRREELLRDQLAHPPLGSRHPAGAPLPVRVGIAGTGERLLVLAWSAADLARERAAGTRLLGALGVEAGMRVANTLPGALATPGSLLLGDVVEELGGLDVPLGEVTSEAVARAAWALVDRVEAAVLILDPASAPHLLAATPAAARPWWRGLVWLACGPPPRTPEIPAAAGFTGWERTWLAVPEATSFAAHSCARGRFHPEPAVVIEVVYEPTGAPLAPGEEGGVALTPLGLDTPCLRYASGLTGRVASEPCGCGEPGPALELR